ncbi:hypothetical protein AB0G05_18030 [Nonomuraea wenchangensis]
MNFSLLATASVMENCRGGLALPLSPDCVNDLRDLYHGECPAYCLKDEARICLPAASEP